MYQDIRTRIDNAYEIAVEQDNASERIILGTILFNLPEDRPGEALENMAQLAEKTIEPDVKYRYEQIAKEIAEYAPEN